MPTRQIGISPKILSQLVTSVIAWVLGFFAIKLSPEASSAIAAGLGLVVGYLVPPGAVAHQQPPTASDDQLDPNVDAQIKAVPPPA